MLPIKPIECSESGLQSISSSTVKATRTDGSSVSFKTTIRIDTPQELQYYRHGGILEFVLRQLASSSA